MEQRQGGRGAGSDVPKLPIEVEEQVLGHVPVGWIGRCAVVCRAWHSIITSPRFWPFFFTTHLGGGHRLLLRKFNGDWMAMTIKCWKERRKTKKRQPSVIGRLGWALSAGHDVLVSKLICKHSISLDTLDGNGDWKGKVRPIQTAVRSGSVELVRMLARKGVALTWDPDPSLCTRRRVRRRSHAPNLLVLACGTGVEMVQALLELWPEEEERKRMVREMAVESKHWNGASLFHVAANSGDVKTMRLLLEDEQTSELAHVLGDSLQTVLHSGVKGGNVEIVELLLQHDPTWAEVRDAQGCTPLCLAFVQQNVQLVQLLLPRRQGGADWTCFHYSNDELRNWNKEMLLLFLQFCFQAPSDSLSLIWGRLLLFLAMSPRKLMFVAETFLSNTQRLKENPTWAPFKPVLQTYSIAPALRTKILRMLLDKGFYPSVTMISWLFFEMFWKHGDQAREVFEFLVVEFPVPGWFAGASVWRYPVERVEVLLPKIDVNQRISKDDDLGMLREVYHLATSFIGQSLLHIACARSRDPQQQEGAEDVVRLLVERGADVNAKDSAGAIPRDLASASCAALLDQLIAQRAG